MVKLANETTNAAAPVITATTTDEAIGSLPQITKPMVRQFAM
jgi:hypothetical protein